MKFIDLFSGIGGFRTGMERAGHECVAFCEWDKYALQSYKAIHNTEGEEEYHDIQKVSNEEWRRYRGTVDIICGGFPCQAFSIAGKRKGFEDTRGTNFFEIARAAQEIQPRLLFLENVKGILNHSGGWTFQRILETLDELGYIVEWGVFNSKFWGVPQNRERVFIIATRKEVFEGPMLFDLLKQQTEVNSKLIDVLEHDVDEKYFLSDEKTRKLTLNNSTGGNLNYYNYDEMNRVYDVEKDAPCLRTMQGGNREPKIIVMPIKEATKKGYAEATIGDSVNYQYPDSKTRRGRVGKGTANTLEASGINQGVVTKGMRIRKLTPLECWRLQGFTDEQFYKAKNDGVSNSQLYKQAGNSVTVNVIEAIAKELK